MVKRVDSESKTAGGIIIPNSAQEKPQEGVVVAVGNGKRLDDGTQVGVDVKKGDRILFGKYSGSEVQLDGEDHHPSRRRNPWGIGLHFANASVSNTISFNAKNGRKAP